MSNFYKLELGWNKNINNNGFFVYFEWDSAHFSFKTMPYYENMLEDELYKFIRENGKSEWINQTVYNNYFDSL